MKKIQKYFILFCFLAVQILFAKTDVYASVTVEEMKERAEAIVNYEWVPAQDIEVWNENPYNGLNYFPAGEIVTGMPYTLFYNELGVDSLLSLNQYEAVVSENYSTTAYCTSVSAERTGPAYGSCCATFVSEILGGNFMYDGNPRYDSVSGIRSSSYGTTSWNVKLDELKEGDAVSNASGGHIIWIGEITEDSITLYEQTPPVARKVTISKNQTDSSGYLVYGNSTFNIVTRSNELAGSDSESDDLEVMDSYPTPFLCRTISTGKVPCYNEASKTSSPGYIYPTDDCRILEIYTNGLCRLECPWSDGTTKTVYADSSEFFVSLPVPESLTAVKYADTYLRCSDTSSSWGWIDPGDLIYKLGSSGDMTQILYPTTSNGYRCGWVFTSELRQSYTISFDANGGENAPDAVTADSGSAVEIPASIPARAGYTFKGWSLDKNDSVNLLNPCELFCGDESLTIYAIWEENSVPADEEKVNPFTDVKKTNYFYDAVLWAVENGITSGTSVVTFAPSQECTRAQVVMFLWRYAGKPEPEPVDNPFTDVKESSTFYKAIIWAVENGITSGSTKTTFSPNATCTRQQIAMFLWRYAGKPAHSVTKNPFTDVKSSGTYYNAIMWAVENGITSGKTATTFVPTQVCTRAQIVTFLYRMDKLS